MPSLIPFERLNLFRAYVLERCLPNVIMVSYGIDPIHKS